MMKTEKKHHFGQAQNAKTYNFKSAPKIPELWVEVKPYRGNKFPSADYFAINRNECDEDEDREVFQTLQNNAEAELGSQDTFVNPSNASTYKVIKTPHKKPQNLSPEHFLEKKKRLKTHSGVQYELIRTLGHGGQGSVYLAHRLSQIRTRSGWKTYRKPVALKFIPSDRGDTNDYIQALMSEWAILSQFHHQNIVQSQSLEQDRETNLVFVEYDYIPGVDLDRFRKWHQKENFQIKIPDLIIGFFGWLIASGLSYAHQKGILHMDVKPQNILIGPQGYPLLCDFGISKPIEYFRNDQHTTIDGTVEYIPPEVSIHPTVFQNHFELEEPWLIDGKVDAYQLGCTLYLLATGYHPNKPHQNIGDPHRRMKKVIHQQLGVLIPPDHLVPMDHTLSNLIVEALEPNPVDRISIEQLETRLAQYLYPGGLGIVRQDIVNYTQHLKNIQSLKDCLHEQQSLQSFYLKTINHRRISRATGENKKEIPLSDLFEPLIYTPKAQAMIEKGLNPARPLRLR